MCCLLSPKVSAVKVSTLCLVDVVICGIFRDKVIGVAGLIEHDVDFRISNEGV